MKLQEQTFTTRARLGVLAGALLGLSSGTAAAVRAQGGPSVAPAFSNEILSALGLPEITLTQLEDGTVEGLPDELSAGTYLVTIASDGAFATYINFVQPPAGLSTEAATAQMLETAESPLGGADRIMTVDPETEAELIADVEAWRAARDHEAVTTALDELRCAAEHGDNLMPPSIALARAGGTTGEWAATLREVFGEYRAPTGVSAAVGRRNGELTAVAEFVKTIVGGPPKFLVAKPGLDGHSNGAEQIAVAARDAGMEVVYSGIRLTPEQIAASARDEDPDVVGLSILSGSHLSLVPDIVGRLRDMGVDAPLIVGGIIPEDDREWLLAHGVARVYTPKDFEMARIMRDVAELAVAHRATD